MKSIPLGLLCALFALAAGRAAAAQDIAVRMTFEGGEALMVLRDTPAGRDLRSLLPLTLDFEDYGGTEKISYPPRALSTTGTPGGCTPSAGDVTLYAPWGNLAIFYRDFRYSPGLLPLGRVQSGMDKLTGMKGPFKARLELAR